LTTELDPPVRFFGTWAAPARIIDAGERSGGGQRRGVRKSSIGDFCAWL
jgi:hypothetical protein